MEKKLLKAVKEGLLDEKDIDQSVERILTLIESVINLKKKEIANTYIIGPDATKVPVYGIAVDDDYIYALSTDFIYKAKKKNSNLLDYNYWQEDKMPLKTTEECKTLFKFANSFFTIKDKNIVYKIDTITTDFYKSSDIAALSFTNNKMIISGGNDGIRCYNEGLSEIKITPHFRGAWQKLIDKIPAAARRSAPPKGCPVRRCS